MAALAKKHVSNATSRINEFSTKLFKNLMIMPEYRNKMFIRYAKFKLIIFGIQLFHSLWKFAFILFFPYYNK